MPDEYSNASDPHPLIAQLLYNRGIKLEDIDPFLSADPGLEGNPFLLPDISQAVSRIYKALLAREKIAVYSDFDVDGVTAAVILVEGLSRLGAEVIFYIPNRFSEGHGLKISALEKLQAQGADLVITADCGVTDLAEVKHAQKIGIDVVITDHHIPLGSLPQAIAVVDPKRKDSVYPYPDLAGAGVAFKLLQALFHKDSKEKWLARFLDLLALATVTDLVSLVGENRYLVKEGLRELNNSSRAGIQEMVKLAGLKLGELATEDISWVLGPRLNAAGRMNNASTSYQLLTTQSPEEARLLALELERRNAERQKLTNEVLSRAREKLAAKLHLPVLIDGDESYSIGVIGLVAGKLVDEFYKPAIIISLGPELCQGSCRSIPEFDVAAALAECHNLLFAGDEEFILEEEEVDAGLVVQDLHLGDDVFGAAGIAFIIPHRRDGTERAEVGAAATRHHAVAGVFWEIYLVPRGKGDGVEVGEALAARVADDAAVVAVRDAADLR